MMVSTAVALALPMAAANAVQQAGTPAPAPPAATAAKAASAKDAQPPSPFLQCDGDTGHVSAGESIGRLIAVTATLGLSELGTRNPDIGKRLTGDAGATACDTAIARESNATRRARLGVARTVHLLEAGRNEAALASAREIATLGQFATDWGLRHTMGAGAMVLEAQALARMGRAAEAEDAAMRAGVAAEYDVVMLSQVVPYLALTDRMTDDKRRVLAMVVRLIPNQAMTVADVMARSGDLAGASRLMDASAETGLEFADVAKRPNRFDDDATRAIFGVLTQDPERSRTLAADTRRILADRIAAGEFAAASEVAATIDEWMAFVDIALMQRAGQTDAARAAFGARGKWLLLPGSLRHTMVERLYQPGGATGGVLGTAPAEQRKAEAATLLAMLTHAERTPKFYAMGNAFATDSSYATAGKNAWKVGAKPKYLVRRPATATWSFDLVQMGSAYFGMAAGEATLLHTALIARDRGSDGFVIGPAKRQLDILAVRFGTIGTPGFPRETTLATADVIAALSPHMPQPVERR